MFNVVAKWWQRRKQRAALADLGEKVLAHAQQVRPETAQEAWDRKKQPRSKYARRNSR